MSSFCHPRPPNLQFVTQTPLTFFLVNLGVFLSYENWIVSMCCNIIQKLETTIYNHLNRNLTRYRDYFNMCYDDMMLYDQLETILICAIMT